MPVPNFSILLACLLTIIPAVEFAKQKTDLLTKVHDIKEWKKILRTKTNVLAVFTQSEKYFNSQLPLYTEVAETMKGLATLVHIDCGEDKKLCKKLKSSPEKVELKHYKDGEFNKVYDRKDTVKSLSNFLRDPTGDLPWDEDSTATDVLHIENRKHLNRLITKEKKPMLVMFYAPWCGFCKRLKPDYSAAATELKGHSILAGIDVDKSENMQVRAEYNITGFPTLLYFDNGVLKYKYGGENNKQGLVDWMKNPGPPTEPEKEVEWVDTESDVVHLSDSTFDTFVKENPSVLVIFYAPWCGHCKKMKPEYETAASRMKIDGVEGTLAAVDATKEKELGDRFKVKGFPTVKYFQNGEVAWDYNERTAEKIVEFMSDPKEPPPPPPPEADWSESPSDVVHLDDSSFKSFLKKKKHVFVMFYAPWCGHCKKAKPEFTEAATELSFDNKVKFAAIDCTKHSSTCGSQDVSGYPTFKYFNYGKNEQKYAGGREKADFVNFMKDPTNPLSSMPPPPPSPEEHWNDATGHENIHHLSVSNFDIFLAEHDSVLVMFYAPWCGHCKAMKPAYAEAATRIKSEQINGALAAVDATVESSLSTKYGVKGFPTLKYFKSGKESIEYSGGRKTHDILNFMKNPSKKESPPPEPKWSDEPSNVHHLQADTFEKFVNEKSSVLIMFYAPWCGHCKKAKPSFTSAAESFAQSDVTFFAAVDCTSSQDICSKQEVSGYPTFKYYKDGKFHKKYEGGRSVDDFVYFMQTAEKSGSPKVEL